MTRLYSHTGDDAAKLAVNALPEVMGEAKAISVQSAPVDILQTARTMLQDMTAANWETKRDALIVLLPPPTKSAI